jgi:probable F420-dependent oxidoreductase
MATRARIGLMIPGSFAGAMPPPSAFNEFFRGAEELGFDALWTIDRIFHDLNILDPLTLLTHAAAVTSRLRLGTAVLLFAFRNPVLVAKTAATLDYLSGGRLTLGVSLGGRDYEFASQGIPITQRVSRLRENLTVMRKLWTEQNVTFHGRHYHLDQVNMEPKPVQKPGIPILMGGSVDAVLKRSAEEANGWIAGSRGTPETFHEAWQKVQAYARAAGKDPPPSSLGSCCTSTLAKTASCAGITCVPSRTPIMVRSTTSMPPAFLAPPRNARRRFRTLSTREPRASFWRQLG